MNNRPLVGVAVIVLHDKKVLIGKRIGKHAPNVWGFPGGHLEFGESIEECAQRETLEEAGITIKNLRLGPFTNDVFKEEQKHSVTHFAIADYESGEVEVKEPEKCSEWIWVDWNNLPKSLFLPVKNLLKQNFNPIMT